MSKNIKILKKGNIEIRKFLLWTFIFGLVFTLHGLAIAEDEKKGEVIKLDEIVVTATRTEKDVDSAPGSVTVITNKDIKRLRIHTVDEAIKYEAGVFARHTKGLANSMPKVELRGLYGPYRTLVMLNGVPLNAGYNGLVDWNTVSTENVERIEIIRGPSSALYGGNAMGGVINIITKTPKKFYANVKSGYGRSDTYHDDTYRYSTNLGDRFMDKLSIGLGFEREETNGYPTSLVTRSIKSGAGTLTGGWETKNKSGKRKWVAGDTGDNTARRWNFHLETKYDLTDTGSIAFNFQRGFHRYAYDRPHTYLQDKNGNPAYSGSVDCGGGRRARVSSSNYLSGMGEKDDSNYSLAYKEIFGPVIFNGKAGYQDRDNWYTIRRGSGTYDNAAGSLKDSNTKSWFTDLQTNIPLGSKHVLTSGLYFRYDDYKDREYGLSFYRDEGSKTGKTGLTEGNDRFYAIYLQDEWDIIDKLALFTGVRFDYWEAFDGKSGKIGSVKKFSEPDDISVSPKMAVVFKPLANTIVKGSVGRAFRAPTIYELYKTWTSSWGTIYYSNPDLNPETLWNYEIGVDQYFFSRRLKLSATCFHTDIDDLIYSYYGKDGNNYKNNAGKAKIDGIELGISAKPVDWLRLWGNYTYNDSEIKEHKYKPEVEGKKIANMPVSTANLGADVHYRWITASIAGQYLGRIYKTELNKEVHDVYGGWTQKYWLWNTKLTVAPVKHLEVSFSVDNLFDKKYYDYYLGNDRTYFVEACIRW